MITDKQIDAAMAAYRAHFLEYGTERDAMRMALEAAEKAAWQPIETAPRDGRWVMLWWPHWEQFPAFGFFGNNRWHSRCVLSHDDDPGPTHWHNPPSPPESAP